MTGFKKYQFLLMLCITSMVQAQRGPALVRSNHSEINKSITTKNDNTTIKNAPLEDVLKTLEDKFNIYFNFDDEIVKNKIVHNQTLLKKIYQDSPSNLEEHVSKLLSYFNLELKKIKENLYVIKAADEENLKAKKSLIESSTTSDKYANNIPEKLESKYKNTEKLFKVNGKVFSKNDAQGLPDVNISIRGKTYGTTTNSNGEFQLLVPEDAFINVSSVGYESEELQITEENFDLEIKLVPDLHILNEMVVVGYGTQEKIEVTGAIESINKKHLSQTPFNSFDRMMQGKAAGVHVLNSNVPGGGAQIRIRGNTSINAGNEPLYIVDGMPIIAEPNENQLLSNNWSNTFSSNPLSDLNPEDIVSIEILKDAAATAIYGARAANGVVIITTRKAVRSEDTRIGFNYYTGLQYFTRKPKLLNGDQAKTLILESIANNPAENLPAKLYDPTDPEFDYYDNSNDFLNSVLNDFGKYNNYHITLNGGNEETLLAMSGGYYNNTGIIKDSRYDRLTFNMNINHTLSERISISNSFKASYGITERADGVFASAISTMPFNPLWDEDADGNVIKGKLPETLFHNNHPFVHVYRDNKTKVFRVINSLFVDAEITSKLKWRSSFGIDFRSEKESWFEKGVSKVNPQRISRAQKVNNFLFLNENTLTYNHAFDNGHELDIVAGFTIQKNELNTLRVEGKGAGSDHIPTLNASTHVNYFSIKDKILPGIYSYNTGWGILSLVSRLHYSYKDKYLLSLNFRRDGSSRFGRNNKFANFPAISAGWRMSNEPFLNSINFFDELKVRGSFGLTGNQNIGNESAYSLYETNSGYFGNSGVIPKTSPSPNLSWETTRQVNLGLDVALWSNKIFFTADYYEKLTNDLLLSVQVPNTSGYKELLQNFGVISNRGFEFSLNAELIRGPLTLNIGGNISFNENRVEALPGGKNIIHQIGGLKNIYGIASEGELLGNFYGFIANGVFSSDKDAYLVNIGTPEKPLYELANGREPALDNEGNPVTLTNAGGYKFQGGDMIFTDINGDGTINNQDRTVIGNAQPDFYGGFNTNMSFRRWELNTYWNFQYGNEVLSYFRMLTEGMWNWSNATTKVLHRWRKQGDVTDVPRAVFRDDMANNSRSSTRFVENGSFLRLNTLNLAYNAGDLKLGQHDILNCKVYFNASNLITFTRYLGNDPEIFTGGIIGGIDFNTYPVTRNFSLGISFNL